MVVEGCREPEREGVGVAPDAGRLRHRAEEARRRRRSLGPAWTPLAAARNVPHDPSQPLMKTPVAKSPAGTSHISASAAAGPGWPQRSTAQPRARLVQQPLHAWSWLGQPLQGSDVVGKEVVERGMPRLHPQQRQRF